MDISSGKQKQENKTRQVEKCIGKDRGTSLRHGACEVEVEKRDERV